MRRGYSAHKHENYLSCTAFSKAQLIVLDLAAASVTGINTPFSDIDLEKESRIAAAKMACAERRERKMSKT